MNWGAIFLTGLTTGGLSCLAVQGGLLSSVIANQKDEELDDKRLSKKEKFSVDQLDWLPVVMFLAAKLVSHVLLGLMLGFLGSKLELSLPVRLGFQALAAVFMLASAANLLQLHPIFRYVLIQPPKFFTRMVRGSTKSKAVFTPMILGLLTVLVPCGVTQAMEVLAITSASPLAGAVVMGLFVVGTMPVFGLVGVGVAKMAEVWQGTFEKVAAVALVLLAISSLNGVLVVLDAPVTLGKIKIAILDPAGIIYSREDESAKVVEGEQKILINIASGGYRPNRFKVKAGIPVSLTLRANGAYSCASEFVFPAFGISVRLKPTDEKSFVFVPNKKGRYTFSCAMGMYSGVMEVI